ncbi:hypothetical protein Pcinc_020045 [Petrolisthes cinctipes]|uniref:Uncharacterized protein n=1 Tax=Petrolisthes cinctipes TaxID=88211 RepID=A0AAE1FNI8_PETCI|nr:hypothetical protein Pcinc_020045 [Petrolisthes cinctipes]
MNMGFTSSICHPLIWCQAMRHAAATLALIVARRRCMHAGEMQCGLPLGRLRARVRKYVPFSAWCNEDFHMSRAYHMSSEAGIIRAMQKGPYGVDIHSYDIT